MMLSIMFINTLALAHTERILEWLEITHQPLLTHPKEFSKDITLRTIYRATIDSIGQLWMATDQGVFIYDGYLLTPFKVLGNDQEIISADKHGNDWYCYSYSGSIIKVNLGTREQEMLLDCTRLDAQTKSFPMLYSFKDDQSILFVNTYGQTFIHDFLAKKFMPVDSSRANRHFEKYFRNFAISTGQTSLQHILDIHKKSNHQVKVSENFLFVENRLLAANHLEPFELEAINKLLKNSASYLSDLLVTPRSIYMSFINDKGVLCLDRKGTDTLRVDTVMKGIKITELEKDLAGNILFFTYSDGCHILDSENRMLIGKTEFKLANGDRKMVAQHFNHRDVECTVFSDNSLLIRDGNKTKVIRLPVYRFPLFIKQFYVNDHGELFILSNHGTYMISRSSGKIMEYFPIGGLKDVYLRGDTMYACHLSNYAILHPNSRSYQISVHNVPNSISVARFGNDLITGTVRGLFKNGKKWNASGDERILKIRPAFGSLYITTTKSLLRISDRHEVKELPYSKLLENSLVRNLIPFGDSLLLLNCGNKLSILDAGLQTLLTIGSDRLGTQYITHASSDGKVIYLSDGKDLIKLQLPYIKAFSDLSRYVSIVKDSSDDRSHHFRILNTNLSTNIDYVVWKVKTSSKSNISYATENGKLILADLPAGKYHINATLSLNGQTPFTLSHIFMIKPTFWESQLFALLKYLTYSILLVMITLLFYNYFNKYRISRLKKELQQLYYRQKLQTNRLSPHFLFNSFNPLQHLILSGNTSGALDYIQKITRFLRLTINHFYSDTVPLRKEIEFLTDFISISRDKNPRFDFDVKCNIHQDDLDRLVPTMILQPIIENSLKYGLTGNQPKIIITFTYGKNNNILLVEIRDNGEGLPENGMIQENHSLHIISDKLKIIQKQYGCGKMEFKNEGGAFFRVYLPFIEAEKNL